MRCDRPAAIADRRRNSWACSARISTRCFGNSMARTTWKRMELEAASLLHGARDPANTGGKGDVESSAVVAQVKNVRVFPLSRMEVEVEAIARVGNAKNKTGILMVKRSAGKGKNTPWLIVMTAAS